MKKMTFEEIMNKYKELVNTEYDFPSLTPFDYNVNHSYEKEYEWLDTRIFK